MSLLQFIFIISVTCFKLFYFSYAQCNTKTTCFDCVAQSTCKWSSGCIDSAEQYDNINWYIKYQQCDGDSKSIEDMAYYCYGYENNTVPMSGGLYNVRGKYSKENLFCKYTINEPKGARMILQNYKKVTSDTQDDRFAVIFTFSNNSDTTHIITEEEYKVEAKIKKIVFMYYGPRAPYFVNPFLFDVKYPKGLDVLQIISISIGVAVGGVFIGILLIALILYIKDLIQRKLHPEAYAAEQQQHQEQQPQQQQQQELQQLQPEAPRLNTASTFAARTKKYKQIVNRILKEEPYEISKKCYETQCTICMDAYIEGCLIIILNCKHTFHKKCIKDYIFTTDLGLARCPNCHNYMLDNETVKKLQDEVNKIVIVDSERQGITNHISPMNPLLNNVNENNESERNNNDNENGSNNGSNIRLNRSVEGVQRIEVHRFGMNLPHEEINNVMISEGNRNSQQPNAIQIIQSNRPHLSEPRNS